MHSDNGVVRVQHREYIDDITTTISAGSRSWVIQPSNALCFPWLASIAANFEQYRLLGCVFEYIPTSGSAVSSTNAALGSVSLATQYNTLQPPFRNKIELLNHHFAVSASPDHKMVHPVECKAMYDPYKLYWCRTEDNNNGLSYDSRLFDYGVLNLITQGSQAAYTGGELWVTYDVMLYKPRLQRDQSLLAIDAEPARLVPHTVTLHHIRENPRLCCRSDDEEDDFPEKPPLLVRSVAEEKDPTQ